nr:hypothetical protein [Tanacetum cinerariifolium]
MGRTLRPPHVVFCKPYGYYYAPRGRGRCPRAAGCCRARPGGRRCQAAEAAQIGAFGPGAAGPGRRGAPAQGQARPAPHLPHPGPHRIRGEAGPRPGRRRQALGSGSRRATQAKTELEKLLVDADMSNLAADDFRSRAELIRTEWELALGKSYSNPEWAELQLNFMLAHKYQSEAGKARYKKDLKANIEDQRDTSRSSMRLSCRLSSPTSGPSHRRWPLRAAPALSATPFWPCQWAYCCSRRCAQLRRPFFRLSPTLRASSGSSATPPSPRQPALFRAVYQAQPSALPGRYARADAPERHALQQHGNRCVLPRRGARPQIQAAARELFHLHGGLDSHGALICHSIGV